MDKFKCRVTSMSKDWKTGQSQIVIQTSENILAAIEQLQEKDLSCELKTYRPHRSKDANAYFWQLLDKLAAVVKLPKSEIYKGYIKQIGDNNTVACVQNKAVDELRSGWEKNGIGWVTDTFDSKINGCTNVILYYGSSTYDSDQMHRLIELAVQDCEAVGIETRTPNEIAEMIAIWGENA